jgi:NAD(P)H-quinone oxidoreductase subunit L
MLVALLYLTLGGTYLLVMPLVIFFWLKQRWYVAGSIERVLLYFLVFMFFPGLLVLAPFINFRPTKRVIPS